MPAFRLTGAPNFRDLAGPDGYATADGRRLRKGRVFRSDHLGSLVPGDVELLALHLGPRMRVLDLRGAAERMAAVCVLPEAEVHSLPIEPTIVQRLGRLLESGAQPGEAETVLMMQDTYCGFVRANTLRFAQLFAHVLDAQHNTPLVFHCTAGKDRTGFAAALLLRALGVPEEQVFHDYLLTNARLHGAAGASNLPPPLARVLHSVQKEFLEAAFEAVHQDYGSLQDYLQDGIGLDAAGRRQLESLLLV